MRLAILACLLLFSMPASAQTDSHLIRCGLPAGSEHGLRADFMTLPAVAEWLNRSAPSMTLAEIRQTPLAVPTFEVALARPSTIGDRTEWQRAWFEAVAYPAERSPTAIKPEDVILGRVHPPLPSAEDRRVLSVEFPSFGGGWLPVRWQIVVLACVVATADAERQLAEIRDPRAYGTRVFYVSSLPLSAALGVGAVLGLYVLIGLAAGGVHSRQLAFLRAHQEREGRSIGRLGFAMRPTVVMQDAFGHCSFARFQVLLFTFVLVGVYAYVMLRTGQMPGLSPTVLTLLGITLAGSTLARAAGAPVVDTPNRIWLLGSGVVDPTPREPAWRDLVAGDGEIDVTRVQALAFSVFAAAALVVNGTTDLARFEIPQEINYLMGISQIVYVAGKALPQEVAKRLNEEVRALRDAEQRVLNDPADASATKAFETARNAIGSALFDVFGERFDERALRELTPGRRLPPAWVPAA